MRLLSDGENAAPVVPESWVPPNRGVSMHVHAQDDELFYVLEGEITVNQRNNENIVTKDGCVQLPHGIPLFTRTNTMHEEKAYTIDPKEIRKLLDRQDIQDTISRYALGQGV